VRTIVAPKQHIGRLWGKQRIREDESYRLMKYVLRVDHEEEVLLHNVVTGQLVVLDQEEVDALNKLPHGYTPVMEQLVTEHYLVPEDYDEHQQTVKLRTIMRKFDSVHRSKAITLYTILPTTACNARCYYCFEQGTTPITMSKQTANEVVSFITNHCEGRMVNLTWFGGEPTVAANRITQISEGLRNNNVDFQSNMITNGYLFDEDMVVQAKETWHVRYVQICVDGSEDNYNRVKAYVGVNDNPYQRILRNIELLLREGIGVSLRMNFDIDNYQDFSKVLQDCQERFGYNRLLEVYAYPIIGEYKNAEGIVRHGSDDWISKTRAFLNDIARERKMYRPPDQLPCLQINGCEADNNASITINANGFLVRCCEMFEEDQIVGSVREGFTNLDLYNSWKVIGDYRKCSDCTFFPSCVKMNNCVAKDRCYLQDRNNWFITSIKHIADTQNGNTMARQERERGMQNDFRKTEC